MRIGTRHYSPATVSWLRAQLADGTWSWPILAWAADFIADLGEGHAIDPKRPLRYRAGVQHDLDLPELARQIVRLDGAIRTSCAENDAMESRIEAHLAGMAKRDAEGLGARYA